jgi:hypothetical protein
MPTGREPPNIPTQRCGAVGSLAVHGEEEVTSQEFIMDFSYLNKVEQRQNR